MILFELCFLQHCIAEKRKWMDCERRTRTCLSVFKMIAVLHWQGVQRVSTAFTRVFTSSMGRLSMDRIKAVGPRGQEQEHEHEQEQEG